MDTSHQRPEGALIAAALRASPGTTSAGAAAAQAGISASRWRQIVAGYTSDARGRREVIAPPVTLARIAEALGIGPDALAAAGRADAAAELRGSQGRRAAAFARAEPSPAQRAVLTALAGAGVVDVGEQLEVLTALAADLAASARALRR